MLTLPAGSYITLYPLAADTIVCRIQPLGSYGERVVCHNDATVEAAIAGAVERYLQLPAPSPKIPKIIVAKPKVQIPCKPTIVVSIPALSK